VTALLEYLDQENHFYANYALKLHQNSGIILDSFTPSLYIPKIIPRIPKVYTNIAKVYDCIEQTISVVGGIFYGCRIQLIPKWSYKHVN